MRNIIWLFLISNYLIFAQVKGKIIDGNNNPIAYVNIQVEGENLGTTSEENGEFSINIQDKNKNLVFTTIGFDKKIVKANAANLVQLTPTEYQLNEVVIVKKFGTKLKEIGKTDNVVATVLDSGPKIDAKYFEYLPKYSKTKFIKQVAIQTDSKIEIASFKIHFFAVNSDGSPGKELLQKNYIVTVGLGIKKTFYNVNDLNLQMPKNGIFVAFEKLIIEKNKLEKTIKNKDNERFSVYKNYYPFVLYNYVAKDFQYTFSGGQWIKKSSDGTDKLMIYEPAINLVLSN